eukprot:CAMPEP_0181094550 /NCGR_PEP_ID=MMETSP1071-20121207/10050_1 /TAXON_ID=35127 /ORGANISM="Thalassiosira sp., Strain NH16" /LENGTH=731 /DNA_ID=CAMNT_0023176881 /DNA_START=265 /DNA_END=2459 /DNA_ORIENTATION=-
MGLGGIARDSIVGLNKLVHDEDDDDRPIHCRRRSADTESELRGSWNDGSKGGDDFLSLKAEDSSESLASFETSLNDGVSIGLTTPEKCVAAAPGNTPRSSAAVAAATSYSYSNVSATNSRSLDSYRSQNINLAASSVKGSAQAAYYQGFQYEGYTDYYSEDYASYNYDDYSYSNGGSPVEKKNIFCCLFAPWMRQKSIESEDLPVISGQEGEQEKPEPEQGGVASSLPKNEAITKPDISAASAIEHVQASPTLFPTPSKRAEPPPTLHTTIEQSEPDSLSGANTLGEAPDLSLKNVAFAPSPKSAAEIPTTPHMLSDGHDSIDSGLSTSPDSYGFDEKKQEEGENATSYPGETPAQHQQEEEKDHGPPPIKGVLKVKRCSMSMRSLSNQTNTNKTNTKGRKEDLTSPNKRHFLPTYEAKRSHTDKDDGGNKGIKFNPMARVLTIPSRRDIPLHQKAQIWWQRCDYDEFKKTGRIISKAMECGGSEIWLASSNAWGNRASRAQSAWENSRSMSERSVSERAYDKALSKYVKHGKKDDEENSGDEGNSGENYGNKWWCKFGHSRRGLEHVASSSEGKARQQSVLLATRMVLEEQKRQRANRTKDPNKLRSVAYQYTSWARDLARAAGGADEEAVAKNFDPAARSRAHIFAKQVSAGSRNLQSDAAGGGVAIAITSQILDENTHSNLRTKMSNPNSLEDFNTFHERSEKSLSRRAKGFVPGGGEDTIGFRSVKV